jgi:hypothetical protein
VHAQRSIQQRASASEVTGAHRDQRQAMQRARHSHFIAECRHDLKCCFVGARGQGAIILAKSEVAEAAQRLGSCWSWCRR